MTRRRTIMKTQHFLSPAHHHGHHSTVWHDKPPWCGLIMFGPHFRFHCCFMTVMVSTCQWNWATSLQCKAWYQPLLPCIRRWNGSTWALGTSWPKRNVRQAEYFFQPSRIHVLAAWSNQKLHSHWAWNVVQDDMQSISKLRSYIFAMKKSCRKCVKAQNRLADQFADATHRNPAQPS